MNALTHVTRRLTVGLTALLLAIGFMVIAAPAQVASATVADPLPAGCEDNSNLPQGKVAVDCNVNVAGVDLVLSITCNGATNPPSVSGTTVSVSGDAGCKVTYKLSVLGSPIEISITVQGSGAAISVDVANLTAKTPGTAGTVNVDVKTPAGDASVQGSGQLTINISGLPTRVVVRISGNIKVGPIMCSGTASITVDPPSTPQVQLPNC